MTTPRTETFTENGVTDILRNKWIDTHCSMATRALAVQHAVEAYVLANRLKAELESAIVALGGRLPQSEVRNVPDTFNDRMQKIAAILFPEGEV